MICDALTSLADALAVTDADAYTTYSYDLGNYTPKRDIGAGEPLCLVWTVDTAASVSTDEFDFIVVTATSADLASDTVAISKMRVAGALLTAGLVMVQPVPLHPGICRYIGGKVELGTSSTVTVSCQLLPWSLASKIRSYADNVTWEA